MPAGLVILSNAANAPMMEVSLQGTSTFASDLTYDGSVNFGDLGVFNVNFGLNSASPNWDPTSDVTGDGAVNFNDLGLFNVQFGLQLQGQLSVTKTAATLSGSTFVKVDSAEQLVVYPRTETPSISPTLVTDDEQALAEEIARRMYFAPTTNEEAAATNTLNDFDAVYEELGGSSTDEEAATLELLFDFDADLLADAMLIA